MSCNRFFIIGAPKCGTTSLANWLREHPEIFMSPIKEPHFFSSDLKNQTVKSRKQYDRLFKSVNEKHHMLGEASTWYLYSKKAVAEIEREYPSARYIVMTRDPSAMAHSLYHHNVRVLHEDCQTFEEAWDLQEQRDQGHSIPSTCTEPDFLQYKKVCSLGALLQRLLSQVPANRVLHVPLETMQSNTQVEYFRILQFLGVENDGRRDFPIANEARGHRSRIIQRLLRVGSKARMALGIQKGFGLGGLNEKASSKKELTADFKRRLDVAFADDKKIMSEMEEKLRIENSQ